MTSPDPPPDDPEHRATEMRIAEMLRRFWRLDPTPAAGAEPDAPPRGRDPGGPLT